MQNPNYSKSLINEWNVFNNRLYNDNKNGLNIIFNYYYYYNTNLPNLENRNGLYFPKGYGSGTSFLTFYNNNHFFISLEPIIINYKEYPIDINEKNGSFANLNDVPLNLENKLNYNMFKNIGAKIKFFNLLAGYGNWDQWWGPGIHNSLVLSNNAQPFDYLFFETDNFIPLIKDIKYYFKYMISDEMINSSGSNYYLSAYFLKAQYKNIEIGKSKHILNGGYNDIPWIFSDALTVLLTNKNMKYWDQITDYYISANFLKSKLKLFIELAVPNRAYNENAGPDEYPDHSIASNIGIRKYGAFGKNEIMFGFEYTSTLSGQYYYKIPTPNLYDNIKYNYSSFKGRRWSAHAGTDADDLLAYIGYINNLTSLVYEINFERHGVTYTFPPEVKIESRISATYKHKNTFINIIYENEYYEHYAFADNSRNVWEETFEAGSIQRTHTLLFSLEKFLSF